MQTGRPAKPQPSSVCLSEACQRSKNALTLLCHAQERVFANAEEQHAIFLQHMKFMEDRGYGEDSDHFQDGPSERYSDGAASDDDH